MFEYLQDKISNALKNIKGMGKITEDNINDAIREIRIALLEADVNYEVVKEFTNNIKEKAIGMDVSKSLKPDEVFIKLMKDELINLLGTDDCKLEVNKKINVLMLVGLQGSGKTTTAGKLANYLRKKEGKRPLLVACDIYRPAAIKQLEEIGKSLDVPVFKENKTVVEIALDSLEYAKENGFNYVIIDTAGRLQIDEKLMQELKDLDEKVQPDEKLLVIDAMMGQDAINVIKGFNDNLPLTGAILTKMDSNTKGGVALSIRHLTNIPIKFIGDSEKLDGLSPFNSEATASRILDMGDILAIASKVEEVIDEDEAKVQAKRLEQGKFDLEDFLMTLRQIKKMGPLENILKMLPGARSSGLSNVEVDPKDLAHIEAIISSMTKEERKHPEILKASRKIRIAKGSGNTVEDVNRLLKQFEQMKQMMKMYQKGNLKMPF